MTTLGRSRILPSDTIVERREDGTLFARSPHRLGPYPPRITDRLEHWAHVAPNRVFLADRNAAGGWRTLSYGDALNRVRGVAQALLNRRLSTERPVVILSGNSIE